MNATRLIMGQASRRLSAWLRTLRSPTASVVCVFGISSFVVATSVVPASHRTHLHVPNMQLVIPVYNNQGLKVAETDFRPYIRSGDIFLIVSGNFGGPLNLPWVGRTAHVLKRVYPQATMMIGTGGLSNVSMAAETLGAPIEGVTYIYEPNLPYGPEFSWNFDTTLHNFEQAASVIRAHGFIAVAKPTGRPAMQRDLRQYNWDYGRLAQSVDRLFVQTQTYCKGGPRLFSQAFNKIRQQLSMSGNSRHWVPEISVDPASPNGVAAGNAVSCLAGNSVKGLTGVLMWWSPTHADRATAFLKAIRPAVRTR